MVDNIADFVSKDDEIKRLNAQINMIAGFYEGIYKDRIKTLKRMVKRHTEMRYKEKAKSEVAIEKSSSTVSALLRLNQDGKINVSPADIAKYSFVNLATVYKAKKALK